jgi:hypothetical protein
MLSAGLTVLVATAIDIVLGTALGTVPAIATWLLGVPFLLVLLTFAAFFGVGALSLYLTLQFFSQVSLRTDTLWSLIGCVLLVLLVKSWLPIPGFLLRGFDLVSVMMVTVGCFTAGRRYWR